MSYPARLAGWRTIVVGGAVYRWVLPPLVTPRFVADLIAWCLQDGWHPDDRGAPLELRYGGDPWRIRGR